MIGTGSIGGTIATLLASAGHEVAVTARGDVLAAVRENGLHLDGAWGEHHAHVEASETLTDTPDLVFLCTKAQDAGEALRANTEQLTGTTLVVVQNGLTGLTEATERLPNTTCVGALALYAASYIAPGHVRVTTTANTYLGAGSGATPPAAVWVAHTLETAMPAMTVSNFTGCQWTKLMVNQVNAMPAITGLSAQETLTHPRLRRIITASMQEGVRIGYARGVRFGNIQGLNNAILKFVAHAPLSVAQIVPALIRRWMGSVANPGSTLQSIRRGAQTEIDYLNGAVVAEAQRVNRSAPLNAALTLMVHEVEASGVFFTPDHVDTRLRGLVR